MRESIALAIDSVAVLFTAIALWLAMYRRSKFGLALGAIGLVAVSAMAVLRAYPEPTRSSLTQDVATLRAENEKTKDSLRLAVAELAVLRPQLQETAEKLRQTDESLRKALRHSEVAQREAEVNLRSVTSRLVALLSGRLATKLFNVEMLEDRELVAGKLGTYLLVKLKNMHTGSEFIFPSGEYRIDSAPIEKAVDGLASEVISTVKASGATVEVFVRGGATSEPWVGAVGAGSEFGAISYRRIVTAKQYGELSEPAPFRMQLTNEDLPLLRGAFFRSVISPVIPGAELAHKSPSRLNNEKERIVELILYIKPAG